MSTWIWSVFWVVVVITAGCGGEAVVEAAVDPESEQQPEPGESAGSDAIAPPGAPTYEWGLNWPVREIRRTSSDDTFELVLDEVPIADGSDLCGAGAYATELRHGPEYNSLQIEVELDNPTNYPDLEASGCERRSETIAFVASSPLERGQPIVIYAHGSRRQSFYPDDTGFFECALPTCDPDTGLPAEPPGCGTLRRDIQEGIVGLDLPKRAGTETIACDDKWAIVEVDYGAAACPATGDATNACAGSNIDRAYILLQESGFWDVFDWDEQEGCGEVLQTEPDFPADLCQDLPELLRPSS